MAEKTVSRRSLLKAAGGVAAASAGGAAFVSSTQAASSSWSEVSSPTTKTLNGVSQTVAGPVAVGKDGNVLVRYNGSWTIAVDNGPHTRANALTCCAVTDDGERVWFAGSSGALGAFDVKTGIKYDYTAPQGKTSTWEGISLTGSRENETIYISNGSGEVMKGHHDSNGCVVWDTVSKPGSGSNIPAVDFREANTSIGHAVNTSSQVFETRDSGGTWENVGIPDSQVNLLDVISYTNSNGKNFVYVSAGAGKIYRLDCDCDNWTPTDLGSEKLYSITRRGDDKLVCGGSGVIHELTGRDGWQELSSPVSSTLNEASYGGSNTPDVIVGGGGTILER